MPGPNIYIALLHAPVYNKQGKEVTTSITGFDLHDIARTAKTYDVRRYFVVNPLPAQRGFAARLLQLWKEPESREFNWTRVEALETLEIADSIEHVIQTITTQHGKRPQVIATSAKPHVSLSFQALREKMQQAADDPYLLVFGTGWGLTREFLERADNILEPIDGTKGYNHLPVRSAIAIVLDRIRGEK